MTRSLRQLSVLLMTAGVCSSADIAVAGNYTAWPFEFVGYNAPSANLTSIFGPKIAEVNAAAAGYSFGSPIDPLRNLNVISRVFQAQSTVTIGTGQNGTLIQLQPGDLTFAYTLDYTGGKIGPPESPVKDFQLYRVIIDEVISATPINNPGPFMALGNVLGGAYNTASGFNPKPFVAFPNGFTGEEIDFPLPEEGGPFQTSEAQFSWPSNQQIMPGDKVMALMFCRDVTWMEIGSASGGTGEGGNVLGAGVELKNFPVLIPVLTPEPATGLLIVLGTGILCRRRRC